MSPLKQGILSIVLVAVAAAGWYVYQNPQMVGLARESASEAGGQAAARGENRIPGLVGGAGAVNVITATVETDQGGERVVALGTAKAARSVILYPQVTAMVTELLFKPGETVEAGAVLVRLEDDEQRVALDRARIALAQSEDSLTRAEALAQSKTISSAALSEARMTTDLAKNDVRSAEIALERRLVTAPFAGVIGLTDTSVGDLVSNSTAITTLDDLTTVASVSKCRNAGLAASSRVRRSWRARRDCRVRTSPARSPASTTASTRRRARSASKRSSRIGVSC